MKFLRILMGIIFLALFIFLFVIGALYLFIDPNKLKPVIISEVSKETGYELTIDGNLTWVFYPLFSVKVPGMALKKPNDKNEFLQLRDINLATSLINILTKHQKSVAIFVDKVNFMGVNAEKVSLKVELQNHEVLGKSLTALIYGGTLRAVFTVSDLNSIPKWNIDAELNNVQLQSLLLDLKIINNLNIIGDANFAFSGEMKGRHTIELIKSLEGLLTYNINNGMLFGLDFNYLVNSADAIIHGDTLEPPASPSTPFDRIEGAVKIEKAIALVQKTILKSLTFRAEVGGEIDLLKQQLDLNLQIQPLNTKTSITIPIIIKGEIKEPDIKLDMGEIHKIILKMGIEKAKEKAKEVIEKNDSNDSQNQFLQDILKMISLNKTLPLQTLGGES